jgi:hypothetical protein
VQEQQRRRRQRWEQHRQQTQWQPHDVLRHLWMVLLAAPGVAPAVSGMIQQQQQQ